MKTKLPERYTERNLINPFSSAYLTYALTEDPKTWEMRRKVLEGEPVNDREREEVSQIQELSDADGYFKWMRKSLGGKSKMLLRERLLENEEMVGDMIRRRIMTNMNDDFVECAVEFFVRCKEDPIPWILENYKDIRNPYAQSLLCLVLGIRGTEDVAPFLLEQEEAFRKEFPRDDFKQGPIVALYRLYGMEENLARE